MRKSLKFAAAVVGVALSFSQPSFSQKTAIPLAESRMGTTTARQQLPKAIQPLANVLREDKKAQAQIVSEAIKRLNSSALFASIIVSVADGKAAISSPMLNSDGERVLKSNRIPVPLPELREDYIYVREQLFKSATVPGMPKHMVPEIDSRLAEDYRLIMLSSDIYDSGFDIFQRIDTLDMLSSPIAFSIAVSSNLKNDALLDNSAEREFYRPIYNRIFQTIGRRLLSYHRDYGTVHGDDYSIMVFAKKPTARQIEMLVDFSDKKSARVLVIYQNGQGNFSLATASESGVGTEIFEAPAQSDVSAWEQSTSAKSIANPDGSISVSFSAPQIALFGISNSSSIQLIAPSIGSSWAPQALAKSLIIPSQVASSYVAIISLDESGNCHLIKRSLDFKPRPRSGAKSPQRQIEDDSTEYYSPGNPDAQVASASHP